jgi:general secretion pathway protein A
MYENFYGFNTKPFSLLPDARFLYPSARHRSALDVLEYGLMHRVGVVVVTGEVGSGKTTLLRRLLAQRDDSLTVGLISNTYAGLAPLLPWILEAYGVPYDNAAPARQFHTLVEYLAAQYAQRRSVVLIVDEAQNLAGPALEELRVLTNINADQDQLLQLILVGQPELRATLRDPQREAFAQRIGAEYHLEALAPAEVQAYVRHRLTCAGGDPDLFSPDTYVPIARFSRGLPRLINSLCDLALVYGYAAERRRIDTDILIEVMQDKGRGAVVSFDCSDVGEGKRAGI